MLPWGKALDPRLYLKRGHRGVSLWAIRIMPYSLPKTPAVQVSGAIPLVPRTGAGLAYNCPNMPIWILLRIPSLSFDSMLQVEVLLGVGSGVRSGFEVELNQQILYRSSLPVLCYNHNWPQMQNNQNDMEIAGKVFKLTTQTRLIIHLFHWQKEQCLELLTPTWCIRNKFANRWIIKLFWIIQSSVFMLLLHANLFWHGFQ